MNSFFLVVGIAVAVLTAPKIISLLLPFIAGLFIYLICRRSVRRMERIGVCPGLAAFFALLFFAALAAAVCALIFVAAYSESDRLPLLYQKISAIEPSGDLSRKLLSAFQNEFSDFIKNISVKLLSSLGNIPSIFMILLFSVISAFFFLKDEKKIAAALCRFGGGKLLSRAEELKKTISSALGGYVRAQILLMSIIFSVLSVFLLLFGVENSLLIALGIAFLDAIPVFGTGCVLIPWALYQFLFGSRSLAFGLLALYGVCALIRQILEPKILSVQIGLHPLLTLAGVYMGYKLFGVVGLIAGPAAMLIFVTFIQNRK